MRHNHVPLEGQPFSFSVEFPSITEAVVHLIGDADVADLDHLSTVFAAVRRTGTRMIAVDASRLDFADLAVLRLLDAWSFALSHSGVELRVTEPGPALGRLLDLLGRNSAAATPRHRLA